jgi:hypothetical protein
MSRSRNFTITHNNYPDTVLEDGIQCKYIIYGREVGASGTPHLQGFISFDNQMTLSAAIKRLPGCHVEIAIAPDQAIEYCKKEGDYTERGSFLSQKEKGKKEKDRWANALQAAKEGRIDDIDPEIYLKYKRTIHEIEAENRPIPATIDGDMEHEWIHGPAGCGKSSAARQENPEAYIKDLTKWWDNYEDQDVCIIDDVDKYDVKFARMLKLWCDRYPFQAEMKGKQKLIRPRKIVITSQYHPDEIWEDEKTQEAMHRRLKIKNMSDELPNKRARCFECVNCNEQNK